jgi:hypothetical protein
VSEIRKLISRWHRDELGAERKAARHLEASRAVLGLAAAARGATAAEGDESGIPKMPLIGRARSGVVRPDQGQKVTGLGGSPAKTNKQYSGQIQAILAGALPSEP